MAGSPVVPIRIEPVDPTSERDLADAAEVLTAAARDALGDDSEPATDPREVHAGLRVDRDDIEVTALLARDGERPVGYAFVDIRHGMGNEHMAWAGELFVRPDVRRVGTGRALLAEIESASRAAGRTLLLGGFAEGDDDGAAFARSVGATEGHRERQNRARTADLDRSMLDGWVADAAEHAAGYSLVCFDDRCPDDLIDDFMQLTHTMNDAPRTDSLEDFTYTADNRRATEAEQVRAGIASWYVLARRDDTGELAGYTELALSPWSPWRAEQGDTAVAAAHRGHGIGRWLKAVNALRLLDERPQVEVIETWNDGTNRWMLAINDAMGFRPVVTWVEAELHLA
jgi:GNAT superfamily N-acetyltransferase